MFKIMRTDDEDYLSDEIQKLEDILAEAEKKAEQDAKHIADLLDSLRDIGTYAHCVAIAGPSNTPTLEDAWVKFSNISVKATNAIWRIQSAASADQGLLKNLDGVKPGIQGIW